MVPADDAEGVPGAKTGRRRAAPDAGAGDCVGNPPVVEAAEAAEVADAPVGAIPEDRADGAADRARPPGAAAGAGREAGAAGAEAREPSGVPAFGSPGRATMESPERADAELASDAPVPVSMGWVGAPPRSRALSSASVADTRAPPGAVGDAAGAVPAGGGVAGRAAAGRGVVHREPRARSASRDPAPLAPDRGATGRACGVEEVVALSGAADGR